MILYLVEKEIMGVIEKNRLALCREIEVNARLWDNLVEKGILNLEEATYLQVSFKQQIPSHFINIATL